MESRIHSIARLMSERTLDSNHEDILSQPWGINSVSTFIALNYILSYLLCVIGRIHTIDKPSSQGTLGGIQSLMFESPGGYKYPSIVSSLPNSLGSYPPLFPPPDNLSSLRYFLILIIGNISHVQAIMQRISTDL